MKNWLKDNAVLIISVVIGIVCTIVLVNVVNYFSVRSSTSPNTGNEVPSGSNPQISSSFSVVPKSSPEDSDLVIEHHYKATIDGETVNVPIRTVSNVNGVNSSPAPSVPNTDNPSSLGNTVSYKQELDLTPLLSDYEHKKNWEVGAGVGCHDGDVYFPVSVQRNFSHDRAVEGVVHLSDSGSVTGGEVLYKHRF